MECASIILRDDMLLFEDHLEEYMMKGDLETLSFRFNDHIITIDKTCFKNGCNQFWISFKVLKPAEQEWENNPFSKNSYISTMDPAKVFQVLNYMYKSCRWQENTVHSRIRV